MRYREQPISLTQQGKSHLEFLALLAAAPGGAVHRDVLEQVLWPQLQESGDLYEGRKPNRASAICTRLREEHKRKYGASEPLDDPLFNGDPETEGLCEAMRAQAERGAHARQPRYGA